MTWIVEKLEEVLVRLLDDEEPAELGGSDKSRFHRHDTQDYVYVALDLPARFGPDIDISFHQQVCEIRIQRH